MRYVGGLTVRTWAGSKISSISRLLLIDRRRCFEETDWSHTMQMLSKMLRELAPMYGLRRGQSDDTSYSAVGRHSLAQFVLYFT